MENRIEENEFENNNENIRDESIEYLKSIGLHEISNRTFIHEGELKRFLDGDFRNINKAKAMGFIQILQREYRIDLSNLRNRYLEYMKEHQEEESLPKESLIMEEVKSEQRTKSFFTFLILLIAIGTIIYLIKKYDLLKFEPVLNNSEQKVEIPKVEQNKIPNEIKIAPHENSEKNNLNNEEINKEENRNENNINLSAINTNIENKSNNQENIDNSNKEEELDLSKLNTDLIKQDEQSQNIKENTEETNLVENIENEEDSNNTQAVNDELYIIPDSKVWIGTIDLDNFKKKDFLIKKGDRIDIDTSTNKLIMIGHKFVKLYFNGKLVKFKRRGPIRFKYIDGQLEEINRREFNKLAKGRHW